MAMTKPFDFAYTVVLNLLHSGNPAPKGAGLLHWENNSPELLSTDFIFYKINTEFCAILRCVSLSSVCGNPAPKGAGLLSFVNVGFQSF
jgi:hypothetical protein